MAEERLDINENVQRLKGHTIGLAEMDRGGWYDFESQRGSIDMARSITLLVDGGRTTVLIEGHCCCGDHAGLTLSIETSEQAG